MNDPRIEIPSGLRNAGILGGFMMIVLGLWMAWKQSDTDIVLESTGHKPTPAGPVFGPPSVSSLPIPPSVRLPSGLPPTSTRTSTTRPSLAAGLRSRATSVMTNVRDGRRARSPSTTLTATSRML